MQGVVLHAATRMPQETNDNSVHIAACSTCSQSSAVAVLQRAHHVTDGRMFFVDASNFGRDGDLVSGPGGDATCNWKTLMKMSP